MSDEPSRSSILPFPREIPAAGEPESYAQEIERLRLENETLKRRLQEVSSEKLSDQNARRAALNQLANKVAARASAERVNAERQRAERELAAELDATGLLQRLSSRFICEEGNDNFHGRIVDTAMTLMGADCGSMQLLDPRSNTLRLLASKGFHPDSAKYWETVSIESGSTCGLALKVGERRIMLDVEDYAPLMSPETMEHFRRCGIRGVLSTPLVSRRGEVVGMLSTHWHVTHEPSERELRFLDLLARQAADLLERQRQEAVIRESEEDLRASEEKYRTLFDSMDEGYCIIQMIYDQAGTAVDWRFLEVNPAFELHTGLRNAVGKTILELAPGLEPKWMEIYHRVAVTGESLRIEEDSPALGRTFDLYAFRVGEPDERKVAVLFNDITARKRSEVALHDANLRKDEFLAMLAHELRNPLAAIHSAGQLLERDDSDPKSRHHAVEILNRQTSHMVRQVDDLLDVSRISRGKIELRKELTEIGAVINHAVEAIQPLRQRSGHELVVTLPPQPLHVRGDPARLTQVVGNLLTNACKFTAHGGKISLTLEQAADQAVIRVSDDGIGIAPAHITRIFEIFAQVGRTPEGSSEGLGLGLPLVKKLVELHGGTVEARSEGLGHGSQFVVRLPLACSPAASPSEPAGKISTKAAAAKSLRVLVVDDNRDVAGSMAMVLEMMGHRVEMVHDGPAAIEKAASWQPDAILLDIGMPGMNGYEVARQIRGQGQEGLMIVAVTGWGQEDDRQLSKEAGFDAHLVKPVDIDMLMQVFAEVK